MAKLNRIVGDALYLFTTGKYNAFAHGCNCFNSMSGGIALEVSKLFYDAQVCDNRTQRGDRSKLGTFSSVKVKQGIIYNLYTQYEPGRCFDYEAFSKCLIELNLQVSKFKSIVNKPKLIVPMIGAGIGGGDKYTILRLMEQYLTRWNVTVVEYYEPKI